MKQIATDLLASLYGDMNEDVANGSLKRYVVSSVDATTGNLFLAEVGSGDVHDEPYIALDNVTGYAAGDYVIVGEMIGRGADGSATRVVLGKRGANSPAVVMDAASQATATPDASTASTTTFGTAITLPLVLPAGTWAVKASGSILLSHNVSQGSWRIEIDGQFSNTHTLAMVTEQRFSAALAVANVAGGRTINVRMQYRSFTAGTTTARNPTVEAVATRQ